VKKQTKRKAIGKVASVEYGGLIGGIAELLEAARRSAARSVNALMTATYWEIGRRIVEFEQGGKERAAYGEGLLARLSEDLISRFGRGFGVDNLQRFRAFFLSCPPTEIYAALSSKSGEAALSSQKSATPSRNSEKRLAAEIEKTREMLERRVRR
jgi:hypothetical protein